VDPVFLPASGRAAQPWRNGGGLTREVAAGSGAGGDFGWRVSLAEVEEPGPFSVFPEVDRTIVLLSAAGMVLQIEGDQRELVRWEPFRFPGEAATEAFLAAGPTADLNVMVRRGRWASEVQILGHQGPLQSGSADSPATPGDRVTGTAPSLCLLLALAGPTQVRLGSQGWALEALDAVVLDAIPVVQPAAESVVAVISLWQLLSW